MCPMHLLWYCKLLFSLLKYQNNILHIYLFIYACTGFFLPRATSKSAGSYSAKIPTGVWLCWPRKIEFMKNKTTKETSRAQLRNGNSINFLSKEKMEKYGSSLQSLATAISLGLASERRIRVYVWLWSGARASGRGELLDQNKCLRKPMRGNWVQSAHRRFLHSTRVGLLWQQWPGWHAADRVAARASERCV